MALLASLTKLAAQKENDEITAEQFKEGKTELLSASPKAAPHDSKNWLPAMLELAAMKQAGILEPEEFEQARNHTASEFRLHGAEMAQFIGGDLQAEITALADEQQAVSVQHMTRSLAAEYRVLMLEEELLIWRAEAQKIEEQMAVKKAEIQRLEEKRRMAEAQRREEQK